MEIYMGELRPTVEPPHRLGIPCAHFDIIYVEFCFELLSVQPYTNQLDLWDRKCLSTEPGRLFKGKIMSGSSYSTKIQF